MSVIADKVLVVFLDAALADGSVSGANPAAVSKAFDEVAARGSNGFLVLPDSPQNAQGELSNLEYLLSVERNASGMHFKFPKMPVAFFSASANSCALASSLGFARVVNTSAPDAAADSASAALAPAKELLAGNAKQFVFVHVSAHVSADHWVHDLVLDVLQQQERNADSRSLVALVQTAHRTHDPQASGSLFRPRQSYEKVDGKYPTAVAPSTASSESRRLLYSFYQKDRTRRDGVEGFDETQIDTSGCYGTMSALMFLKEMAFRLGFAPKYGA